MYKQKKQINKEIKIIENTVITKKINKNIIFFFFDLSLRQIEGLNWIWSIIGVRLYTLGVLMIDVSRSVLIIIIIIIHYWITFCFFSFINIYICTCLVKFIKRWNVKRKIVPIGVYVEFMLYCFFVFFFSFQLSLVTNITS